MHTLVFSFRLEGSLMKISVEFLSPQFPVSQIPAFLVAVNSELYILCLARPLLGVDTFPSLCYGESTLRQKARMNMELSSHVFLLSRIIALRLSLIHI